MQKTEKRASVAVELQLTTTPLMGRCAMSKKVLIVDDSQAEVHLMQSMLQQGGFHSVGISDSTKIEEAIDDERPNVILLDVVMPRRNGFQACRDLKSQSPYANIPVILVTSKTAPSDRYWGEQQGANGYVAKPFTPDELLSAVKRFA
jgi:twitching motility two-component system response regulator PilH